MSFEHINLDDYISKTQTDHAFEMIGTVQKIGKSEGFFNKETGVKSPDYPTVTLVSSQPNSFGQEEPITKVISIRTEEQLIALNKFEGRIVRIPVGIAYNERGKQGNEIRIWLLPHSMPQAIHSSIPPPVPSDKPKAA